MGNVRVCCQPCTRYRIGQARAAALPDVMLDNNALRRRIGHDKVARKACSLLAGGNEYKVHRLVQRNAPGQADEGSIAERTSDVMGKRESVRVELGCRRTIK